MKYFGGSCSLFENRKLVFEFSSFLVFKLSALRKVGKYLGGSCSLFENRKLVFKSSSFLVFKLSVLRKVGKIIREMRPCRENEKGSELGVMTRQLRCLFVLLVRLFVIDAASLGG